VSFVIDNSVVLAWCFEDEQTEAIMELLDRVVAEGAVAPQLWPLEALNGLLTAERRGRIDADARRRMTASLRDLPIEIDVETTNHVWTTTARLAELHQLTAYDSAYLELALRRDLPLASRDQALIIAARGSHVSLLPTT